jgi:uncharacterized protein
MYRETLVSRARNAISRYIFKGDTDRMATTLEELSDALLTTADVEEPVADVRIGLGYTAVKLRSGRCGVACMLRHRLDVGHCSLLSQAGTLAGLAVGRLLPFARSNNVVETSVGLAAINALADGQTIAAAQPDLLDALRLTQQDQAAMIGCIEPLVPKIKARVSSLTVFDEAKSKHTGLTDLQEMPNVLADCDVVLISATSLLNHTFDTLLTWSARARDRCVLGPSTPLFAEFFQNKGITVLAGRQILDADKILQIVSEAGGTQRFGKVTRKINLIIREET